MASDIPPLAPANPSPLVREKRHFHGEHKHNSQQQKQSSSESDKEEKNAGNEAMLQQSLENIAEDTVNPDVKHATVRHFDEYV